jgi:hypothetical protein
LADAFGEVEWQAERSFACDMGFGGKVDLFCRHPGVVIDFKTKDFDDPQKVSAYDEHGMQLAAYAFGLGIAVDVAPQRWNIFVSTRVPGLIVPVFHDENTYQRHFAMFRALLTYWQADKNYAPGSTL